MFEDRDKGRDRVRHVDTDGDTNLLIRKFCLSGAHAIVPPQKAIIQRDPKFRVFIGNGLFEGRNKGRDKRRHADTNDDTKIPNQKVLSE